MLLVPKMKEGGKIQFNKFGERTKMRLIAFAVVVEVVVAVIYSDLFLWS